jgi:hypothetical protein
MTTMKHIRYIRVSYIVGWEGSDSGLLLMYADGRRELIRMSPEEADENSQFMIDNMFEDNRDVIGIAWEDVEPTEPRAGENRL